MCRPWGRLTYLAEARKLEDSAAIEAAAERYYRYFPDSQNYHKAHDFDFWVLEPVRHRYIGGFGAIHWIDQLTLANPFAGKAEASMVEHMNADHAKAIAHYVELTGLPKKRTGTTGGYRQRGHALAYWPGPALAGVSNALQHPDTSARSLGLSGSRRAMAEKNAEVDA
nr:hypothetical protein GCM10020185_53470 [Pseudomonas brassicacearum subsp. brassicacearum]